MRPRPDTNFVWQPSYVLWASSVYVGSICGMLAASRLSPMVAPETTGWGLPALMMFLQSEPASLPVVTLALALAFVLVSLLPGLLSLFLITLTDLRLRLHPIVGGAFFGIGAGWVTQSPGGAAFGALFGLVSLGVSAVLMAARRTRDRRTDT